MAGQSRQLLAEEVADADPSDRTVLVKTGRGRELRVRSHRVAQLTSGALALLILVITAIWFRTALEWWDPCGDVGPDRVCDQPTAWFRHPQMAIALIGLVSGLLIATYLGRFALVGRIWRRSRQLAVAHGSIVIAWLIVWTVGAIAR